MKHGIAVKGLIIHDDKALIIKRRPDDVHQASAWDIPGGRLDEGEDPFSGLKRELLEETGLSVSVKEPLAVNHFTRDDGQVITMIILLCACKNDKVSLSEEHTDSLWLPPEEAKQKLDHFHDAIDNYARNFKQP